MRIHTLRPRKSDLTRLFNKNQSCARDDKLGAKQTLPHSQHTPRTHTHYTLTYSTYMTLGTHQTTQSTPKPKYCARGVTLLVNTNSLTADRRHPAVGTMPLQTYTHIRTISVVTITIFRLFFLFRATHCPSCSIKSVQIVDIRETTGEVTGKIEGLVLINSLPRSYRSCLSSLFP